MRQRNQLVNDSLNRLRVARKALLVCTDLNDWFNLTEPNRRPLEGACPQVGRQSESVVSDRAVQPKRRRRSEFVTTDTLLRAMAPAAIMGLSNPAAAKGIAATL